MQKQSNYKVHRSQFLSKPIYGSLKNKRDNTYFLKYHNIPCVNVNSWSSKNVKIIQFSTCACIK